MASINPFQPADSDAIDGVNESIANLSLPGRRARRASGSGSGSRRGARAKQRKQAARASMDHGWPAWEGLRPVILFLMYPALFAVGVALTGPWPMWILYGAAAVMGLYVFSTSFHSAELVLACFLLYLPFSTTYVIPVAPGVNGTNMLILLGLFASMMRMVNERQGWIAWPRGTTLVFIFAGLSFLSAFTIMRQPGGYIHLMHHELLSFKGWVDQFILYFIALSCIRTIDTAKRVVLYMGIGAIILVLYSVPEMMEKAGRSSIDKSRIGGPHQQANMFGGFVAYTMLPLVGFFVTYIKDIRAWLLTPYFLIAAKVLISTFSRGAYLAMAMGAFMAAYFKGKGFLIMWATLGVCVLLVFPSVFPDAIKDRLLGGDKGDLVSSQPAKMDKSSEHRIILWRAGGKMILESPILGKGFKGFPKLKSQYTERAVHESDPHNTYIYIASQMGLPALILFLLILGYSFHLGRTLSRNKEDLFIRAIGIGGASSTVCYSIVCIFGSRAVNLEYTAYFWAYLVCMQVIETRLRQRADEAKPKVQRTNAYQARNKITPEPKTAITATAKAQAELEEPAKRLLPSPEGQRARKRSNLSLGEAREKRRRLKHHRD